MTTAPPQTGVEYMRKPNPGNLNGIVGTLGAVTQLMNLATAVTLNAPAGIITTKDEQVGANTIKKFTFNNNYITAGSIVLVSIVSIAGNTVDGTEGVPTVSVDSIAAGSCEILVGNGSANATNAAMVLGISFFVINS